MSTIAKSKAVRMSEKTSDGDIVIGRSRPKNNPLIHRSEVGKPSYHNDLPNLPDNYTFGAPLKRDPEGAGEVMLTWQSHSTSQAKIAYDFGRDFRALNRIAVVKGCTTSKDLSSFRKDNDVRIKPKVTGQRPLIAPPEIVKNPNHIFGQTSGQSESVADLIQNRWEGEWVAEQLLRMDQIERTLSTEAERRMSPARRAARITPAAAAAHKAPVAALKDTFVLPQFKSVQSRYSPSPAPRSESATLTRLDH